MYQKLSVFAAASDKDGQKDLSYLHVINDDEELYWTVSSDKWDKATIRSNEYVGSNGFTMPYGQKLPTGSYRIVIEDWSGKRVEEKIYVKKENVDTEQAQFPVVDQSGGNISVAGNFTDPEIWIYDSNDQFLTRLTLTNKSIAASSVIAKNTEKLANNRP